MYSSLLLQCSSPDVLSSRPPAFLGVAQGITRPDGICNPSSLFRVHLGVSLYLDMPRLLPQGGDQEASWSDEWISSTADIKAPHLERKGWTAKKTNVIGLKPRSRSVGHFLPLSQEAAQMHLLIPHSFIWSLEPDFRPRQVKLSHADVCFYYCVLLCQVGPSCAHDELSTRCGQGVPTSPPSRYSSSDVLRPRWPTQSVRRLNCIGDQRRRYFFKVSLCVQLFQKLC